MKATVKWVQLSSLNLDALTLEKRSTIVENTQFHQEFGKMLRKMTALTELSMKRLSWCVMISGVVPALPPQLEVLDLSYNYVYVSHLCKVLSRMTNLRGLDMNLCRFYNHEVASLTSCLANCPALTSLRMNGLLLSSGVTQLSALVMGLTQLQLLHLEFCNMEDHHVAELVRSLYHHHHLTSLSLSGNFLANESGQALVEWPQLLCLEEVGLNKHRVYRIPVSDTSMVEEALQQSLCFRRIVEHLGSEITFQNATWEACQRNAIRHTTLLSITDDPKMVKGSILCTK